MYKKAVVALARGKIKDAFNTLTNLGFIREYACEKKRHGKLVREYLNSVAKKREALVVSPTNSEGEKITGRIRSEMKKKSLLQGKRIWYRSYRNLNFTNAQCAFLLYLPVRSQINLGGFFPFSKPQIS